MVVGCKKVRLNRGYFRKVRDATEDMEVEVIKGVVMTRTEVRENTIFFEVSLPYISSHQNKY